MPEPDKGLTSWLKNTLALRIAWEASTFPSLVSYLGPALSGGLIPFRPLIFSHSAEVLSKSGNLIVRGASCFGGLGKRLVNGPLTISVEIYVEFKISVTQSHFRAGKFFPPPPPPCGAFKNIGRWVEGNSLKYFLNFQGTGKGLRQPVSLPLSTSPPLPRSKMTSHLSMG